MMMSHQPLMRFSSFFFTCLFTAVPSAFFTCCCFFGVLVFRDLEDPLDPLEEEQPGDDVELPESVEPQEVQCECRVIFRHSSTYNHNKQQQQPTTTYRPTSLKTVHIKIRLMPPRNKINYHTLSVSNQQILLTLHTRPTLNISDGILSNTQISHPTKNKRHMIPAGALVLRTNDPHLTHSNITQPFSHN